MVTKKERNYILGAAAVVLLAWLFFFGGIAEVTKYLPTGSTGGNGGLSWTDQMREDYKLGIGTFLFKAKAYNFSDPTVAFTIATNYQVKMYRNPSGSWIPGPTLDSDGENFEIQPGDNGIVYWAVKVPSGQAFYIMYDKTETDSGGYITDTLYVDVDADTKKEIVYKYDCKGHQLPGSGYPELSIITYLLTYDASFPALGAAADVNCGNTTVTKNIQWYNTYSAEAKGIAISSIEFKVNTTDLTRVSLKSMGVPGYGTLDGASFVRTQTGTDTLWTYTYSYTFWQAKYLYLQQGGLNQSDWTTQIETTLNAGGNVTATFTMYYLVAQTMGSASKTDDVNLSQNA